MRFAPQSRTGYLPRPQDFLYGLKTAVESKCSGRGCKPCPAWVVTNRKPDRVEYIVIQWLILSVLRLIKIPYLYAASS